MAVNIKQYADLAPNPAYALEYEEYLGDIKTAGIILRHKKSGARICVLANDDENKLFCAAFRTPVDNDTGVPHIIEHSVLNGSKNFPARDPFMQLVKSSLNTFLNAMTFEDKTLYPVASCNDKDFKNLMHVYLDAVFYPNIYNRREIFMQEGWHYDLPSPDAELTVNGVVYSEMKGAMSSPFSCLYDTLQKAMFPHSPYGKNSGGDPSAIPSLTYEDFLDFHRSHYHPSNSYIFLYGNCDMDERLRFMDEMYLSAFDKIDPHTEIPPVTRFGESEPRRVTEHYAVSSTDEVEGKSYFAYAALGNSAADVTESVAWDILSDVLIHSAGAPVKQALLDAGIGAAIGGGYDGPPKERFFHVTVKEAKSEDFDQFYAIVRRVLEEQVERGINEKAISAVLNRMEFAFREADFGGDPRGLEYAITMLRSWLYDDTAAFAHLHILEVFAELRGKIGTGYYENLIKTRILNNDHSVLVLLEPERGLVEKRNEALAKQLAAYKASLSPEEIDKIVADTAHLLEYQSMEPTEEELNCIPTLERSDISRTPVPFSNEERTIGGIPGVYHDVETNGITYATLAFDTAGIPEEDLPYVGLLNSILGKIDTAEHSFADLQIDIKLNTGYLGFHAGANTLYRQGGLYRPMYGIYFRVIGGDKVKYALDTVFEILATSKFEDTKRLREIISEVKAARKSRILNSGSAVAGRRARSYFSPADAYREKLDGMDYYAFLCDLTENFDERAAMLSQKLRAVTNNIFDKNKMMFGIAADEEGHTAFSTHLPSFADSLDTMPHASLGVSEPIVPTKKNEGFMTASQVQYVARAGKFGDTAGYTGALQVVASAVNIDYLYQEIRVKGGAYGCGCNFIRDPGCVAFTSYRDPKLKETDDVYCGTGAFVRDLDPTEEELTRYIIGTFSNIDMPMSAADKINRSFDAYITGVTYEDVLRERGEMLDITPEQFRKAADLIDTAMAQGYKCAVGNEKKLSDNGDMFDALISVK